MNMDERFAHIAKDPRFKKISNRKRKVKIDSRFKDMFNDEKFNTKYFVDKRGRKVTENANEDLSNFYELSDNNDELGKVNREDVVNTRKGNSDDNHLPVNRKQKKKKANKEGSRSDDKRKRMRKLEKNEVEDELADNVDTISQNVEIGLQYWQDFKADVPITEVSTKRLAICNMDWDKITADDLFVLLHSFLPSGGNIISVKIYPSDFGMERMKTEDENGPTELVSTEADNIGSKDQEEEYNKEKLRQYQLNRLKYYYGVVECDCPETAERIYEECDGMEYEASSSHVDLRFIPEDMTFDHDPTSQASEMPSAESYKPSEFITTALQQSTVRLTWDETDPRRVQTTMRNFSKDDLLDMDFKAYLASSSDEDSDCNVEESGDKKENEDRQLAKYRELLEQIKKKEQEDEDGNELEVTWEVGLKESAEELIKRKKDEKERKKLTPWESYLSERKQKKKMKRQAGKKKDEESQSAAQFSDDELPADVDLNDPFFAEELGRTQNIGGGKKEDGGQKKKKKGLKEGKDEENEEDKRRNAGLQLLVMEEDDSKKHFNLKSIIKNEKLRKKRKKEQQETKQDDFKIDVNDRRFSALYSSHLYAVDPSDPLFKKTKAMDSIILEKQRRSDDKNKESSTDHVVTVSEASGEKKTVDHGLSVLVKNVKSNAGKFRDRKRKNGLRKNN